MQPQIRFCEFNASEQTTTEAMSELINMRMHLGDEAALGDEFDVRGDREGIFTARWTIRGRDGCIDRESPGNA